MTGAQTPPVADTSGPLVQLAERIGDEGFSFLALVTDPTIAPLFARVLRAALILIIGIALVRWAGRWIRRWAGDQWSAQRGLVIGKVISYAGTLLVLISVLNELEFSLGPLLGAAGILGIALGFASQTSVSNVISGFFLIAEEPFVMGDVIRVGNTEGEVLSIDTLSVKLRTHDNRFVRIPNETIIKSEVVTLTRFPIRRLELPVTIGDGEEIPRLLRILVEVAHDNPLILMEPAPDALFSRFGEGSLEFNLVAWADRTKLGRARNTLAADIQARLLRERIAPPVRQFSLTPPTNLPAADRPPEGSPEGETP